MPVIRELMGAYATDGEHLLAVCDAHGRLLWVEGPAVTRRAADRMNFVEGARWSEAAAGTNAPGTAIAVDRPVQVFAAEHFLRPVQQWTCAAAPLHDPHTGRVLGAVDITGGDRLAHPHSLAFVQAVARAAESHLALLRPSCGHRNRAAERSRPGRGAAGDGRPQDPAQQTAQRDPGDAGPPSRGPHRRRAPRRAVRGRVGDPGDPAGRTLQAAAAARAGAPPVPPLPALRSGRRRLRHGGAPTGFGRGGRGPRGLRGPAAAGLAGTLRQPAAALTDEQLRAALIARGDPGLLADWAYSPWGEDDLPVWEALAAAVPAGQRPALLARVRALDAQQR